MNASITDYLKSGALYILPHHFISRMVFKLTRIESSLVPGVIKLFSRAFKVNLEEAVKSDPQSYKTFNEFFTREIKSELRPIAESLITSPVDGTISQLGKIYEGTIFQAKGINYSVEQLLGNLEDSQKYKNGQFITIYLSPRDYHRIHMPCAGELIQQTHVPGRLFSVANHTVNTVTGIFARNERVIASFKSEYGSMEMILVGAINVAAIETVWDGLITPPKGKSMTKKKYKNENISLAKGQEMGRFNMGSTVILLFENESPKLDQSLYAGQSIKLGNSLT